PYSRPPLMVLLVFHTHQPFNRRRRSPPNHFFRNLILDTSAFKCQVVAFRPSIRAELVNLFVKSDRYLSRLTAGHERISFASLLERKSVCNELFGMDLPAHDPFDEVFHKPDARNPGSIDGFLIVNDVRPRTQASRPTFADDGNPTPFSCSLNRGEAALVAAACVQRPFYTMSIRQVSSLLDVFRARLEYVIGQTESLRNLQAFVDGIDSNKLVGTHRLRKHERRETHWTQSYNQDRIISGNSDLLESLIDRSETARHLGTIGIGKLVRQRHKILFLSQNIG